jgi:hypothetical protein
MPNEITAKYDASTALTITLASLANAAGRQSTLVDNTSNKYQTILVHANIKNGTSPNANSIVELYLIRSDNDATQHADDGAGTTDAALTPVNAQCIGSLRVDSAGTTGFVMKGTFPVHDPGPEWGIVAYNRTGVALDATGSNHWIRFTGVNPDVQ